MKPPTGLQSNCRLLALRRTSEKHSSLLRFGINYTRKMCYNIEPWGECYDFFTLGIYANNTYCFVQLVKLR
jgi:hypothetical protein